MNKGIWAVIIFIIIAVVGVYLMNSYQQKGSRSSLAQATPPAGQTGSVAAVPTPEATQVPEASAPVVPAEGLVAQDLKIGSGVEAKSGNAVTVHYIGTFLDGKKFDSSRDRGQPFTFQLGGGQVIKGWDNGVVGMKIGGIRKLTVPPDLAYGEAGQPPVIPPSSTLVFEVELLDVK